MNSFRFNLYLIILSPALAFPGNQYWNQPTGNSQNYRGNVRIYNEQDVTEKE